MIENEYEEDLDFSNEENIKKSYEILYWEFFDYYMRPQAGVLLVFVSFIYLLFFPISLLVNQFIYPYLGFSDEVNTGFFIMIDLSISFGIMVMCVGFISEFHYSNKKFPPSLLKYMKSMVKTLEYEIKEKGRFKTYRLFLTALIIILIFKIVFYIFFFDIIFLHILSYLILIFFPIIVIWSKYNDFLIIRLNRDYFIRFRFCWEVETKKKRLFNKKTIVDYCIFMKSYKICRKSNFNGANLYKEISEDRMLPKEGLNKRRIFKKYLYFYEFSNPINFQYKLINIILAVKGWIKQ